MKDNSILIELNGDFELLNIRLIKFDKSIFQNIKNTKE